MVGVECDKFAREGWWGKSSVERCSRGFRGGRSMEDPSTLIRAPCRDASGAPCGEIGLTVTWRSKEQNVVAHPSVEAEINYHSYMEE